MTRVSVGSHRNRAGALALNKSNLNSAETLEGGFSQRGHKEERRRSRRKLNKYKCKYKEERRRRRSRRKGADIK